MRMTVEINDDLLAKARAYTGLTETSTIVHKALTALVQREAAHRLAQLGGSNPGAKPIPRRRSVLRGRG
jgi:Arc/MetJ family transcription regulator